MQAHERELALRHSGASGVAPGDPAPPVLGVQRIADLCLQVGAGQQGRESLEHAEQHAADRARGRGGFRRSISARTPGTRRTGRRWRTSTGAAAAFHRRVSGSQIRPGDQQARQRRPPGCARWAWRQRGSRRGAAEHRGASTTGPRSGPGRSGGRQPRLLPPGPGARPARNNAAGPQGCCTIPASTAAAEHEYPRRSSRQRHGVQPLGRSEVPTSA